jgi:hypothetical protein
MPAIVETIASLPFSRQGAAELRRSPDFRFFGRRAISMPFVMSGFDFFELSETWDAVDLQPRCMTT